MSSQAAGIPGTTGAIENTMEWDHPPERFNGDCPLVSKPSIDISSDDRGLSKMEKTAHFSKFFASRDLIYVHHLDCKIKDLEWTLKKTLILHDETQTTLHAIERIATRLSGASSASLQSEIKRLKAIVLKLHNEIQATTAKISFATEERATLASLANDMGLGVEKLANPVRPDYPMQHAFEILVRDVHEGKIALHESEKKNKALKEELDYEKQSHAEEVTTLVEERDEALRHSLSVSRDGIAWDLQQVIVTASKDHKIFSRDDKWRSRQLQQTWSTIDIPVTSKEDIVTLACLNYPPDHRRPYFGALFQDLCAAKGLAKKARIDDKGEIEMNE
ncbi:hypothetical protein CGCSCA5_v009647 [Colletotrichum siamense]|nr:hypothetical protein CGCSCA5_v009647 [Colletotrichum siamense]KAF4867918.1 hypothetical protein CGCSCA1_v012872 [Colletotrichum siamense]